MRSYDAVVVGSGCGMPIVQEALEHGLRVALVDKGPLGGTCLNVGCIPSKMLIFPADRLMELQAARKVGIEAEARHIDFASIMERMRNSIGQDQESIRSGISDLEELDFYEAKASFVDDYTLEVEGEQLRADTIFLASGSRPLIPPIEGLPSVDYLTNESVLQLKERPGSLIIIGGGYIGAEYGHFFAAMGTEVTILEMGERIVQMEEPEISELLKQEVGQRMTVATNVRVQEVRSSSGGIAVQVRDVNSGESREYSAERLLVAAGRRSNADLLQVEKTGVETDGDS